MGADEPAGDDRPHVRVDRDGPVLVVTLDRPEVLNAFSARMGAELQAAWRQADTDDSIRAVVVTGAGRAFCAGADFSGGGRVFGSQRENPAFSADPFVTHAWDVRPPVIAAINGHAIGLGLTLTLQCDLRYVAADAKLGVVQTRRGVMPDARSTWSLPRLIGHARATEILLTGRLFSGTDAAAWGLANDALAAPDVLPRALAVAHEIAEQVAPLSAAVTKRLLWSDPPLTATAAERLETDLHRVLMGSPDSREGVQAHLEKRPPRWQLSRAADWPGWLDEQVGRPGRAGTGPGGCDG